MSLASIRALALETTSRRGEIALVEGGRILATDAFAAGLKHTAELLPMIDRLCRSHGWAPPTIQEIYVSVGPGAFTGTRIGVTLAKTLAFAGGVRVAAVSTPRVLVENAPAEAQSALVVIDARRGKVWAEHFQRRADGWRSVDAPRLNTLAAVLDGLARPIWLVGEGVAYHAGELSPGDRGVQVCSDTVPRAAVVAELGWQQARRGEFADPFALAPVYVRRPEAEEKRLGS